MGDLLGSPRVALFFLFFFYQFFRQIMSGLYDLILLHSYLPAYTVFYPVSILF